MPYKYTKTDEVNFLNKWFDTWSDLQKDDFLPILAQSVNPNSHLNGFTRILPDMPEGKKKTTIFDCQVKLFQEWYDFWEESVRQMFLNHIKETDQTFSTRLEKVISGEKPAISGEVEVDKTITLSPLSINEVDDGIAGHSSSSSTLSSLTQSQCNNDSCLEVNNTTNESVQEEQSEL